MAYKVNYVCFIALTVAVIVANAAEEKNDDYDSYPSYSFNYDVQDAITGDIKSQAEQREGDVVTGQYSLQEPDGYRRTVEYTADAVNGFKATVRREQVGEPIKALAPVPSPTQIFQQPRSEIAPAPPATPVGPVIPAAPNAPKYDKYEQLAHKSYISPVVAPTYIRAYAAPTLLHHAPATHAVIHHAPAAAVHLTPTAHYVHSAPAAATLLKAAPAVITHHAIHTDAHPAVVKTSFTAPHVSYVY
ncbi:pupal cuticle protein Edg-84A-like [Anastrepha obliqua]|uniref:pupal cuticle protein Edg-84A-like n=1 Tax=Anastrepha obliqua TaxID=95512 RepID=UPI002409B23E|nr:pupal cuticle protein Edg-84A-like [Anastrepha obliqua]